MRNCVLIVLLIGLIGCGANANLTFTTNAGNCAQFNVESTSITESASAPYCMQVTMTNNGGGNNFVNSTTASINSLNMNLSGVSNVLYPATSASTMDPNNCLNSSLNPGSSCTFYMQLNQESYAVEQAESASLVLTYTVQNTLFGNGTSSGTSTLNFFEVTNLYIPEANGNVGVFNAGSTPFTTVTQLFKTTTINLQSLAIDNSVFGYLYLGGSSGIYQYGDKTASVSISPSSFSGANNLINSAGSIYATPGLVNTGVYKWTLSSAAWSNGAQPVFNFLAAANTNVHAISSASGAIYLASANKVYNCNPSSTTSSNSCVQEGATALPATAVTAMSYLTSVGNYTGLYVGTTNGLYAESTPTGSTTSSANTWSQVYDVAESAPISNTINTMTIDLSGNLYAGDSKGNIWLINDNTNANNTAYKISSMNGYSIQFMRVDVAANPNVLYLTATNNSGVSYSLYSCSLGIIGSTPSCFPTLVPNVPAFTSTPIGLRIGSELRTSL